MSIYKFADHTNLSTSTVRDIENKGERAQLRTSTQKILDEILAAAGDLAQERFASALGLSTLDTADISEVSETSDAPGPGRSPQAHPIMVSQRSGLVARRWSEGPDVSVTTTNLKKLRADVDAGHGAYQRADYTTAARTLAAVAAASGTFAIRSSGEVQRQAHRILALAHIGVSKLAGKLGDSALAWVTADRATAAARLAEDHVMAAAADYQVACALLGMSDRIADAAEVAAVSHDELNRHAPSDDPPTMSVRGALLLLAAIVSARQGDGACATSHLADAQRVAAGLGHDGNHLFTAFGPTNVRIHQVSVAVELHRPRQAISLGDELDTSRMPAVLLGRRAQVHLDLAAAFAHSGSGDAPAVLHLLEAERIAPQFVGASHRCRVLLTQLLSRERRSATPGLRGLAQRAGVPA
jgi:hypothetical protein